MIGGLEYNELSRILNQTTGQVSDSLDLEYNELSRVLNHKASPSFKV